MATVGDLLELCFRDSGVFAVGEVPQAQDTTDALRRTNMMIGQWNRRRWLVYHLIDTALAMDGSQFYYVGDGGNFSIQRPDQIDAAYIRQTTNQPVDYPLTAIPSYEDYARIALKTITGGPSWYYFYDSGFPLGKIYPLPIPNSQYELHIVTKAVLQSFNGVGDFILMPPEYEQALYYNIMKAMRMAYRMKADDEINRQAKTTLETIRSANFQVATLQMPTVVRGGGGYNVMSDSWGPGNR